MWQHCLAQIAHIFGQIYTGFKIFHFPHICLGTFFNFFGEYIWRLVSQANMLLVPNLGWHHQLQPKKGFCRHWCPRSELANPTPKSWPRTTTTTTTTTTRGAFQDPSWSRSGTPRRSRRRRRKSLEGKMRSDLLLLGDQCDQIWGSFATLEQS